MEKAPYEIQDVDRLIAADVEDLRKIIQFRVGHFSRFQAQEAIAFVDSCAVRRCEIDGTNNSIDSITDVGEVSR